MKVHAHHDDYAKPLDVRWLCPLHHKAVHHDPNGFGASFTKEVRFHVPEDMHDELISVGHALNLPIAALGRLIFRQYLRGRYEDVI